VPVVELVTTIYERVVTLTREAMADEEAHLTWHPGKWFVDIGPPSAAWDT